MNDIVLNDDLLTPEAAEDFLLRKGSWISIGDRVYRQGCASIQIGGAIGDVWVQHHRGVGFGQIRHCKNRREFFMALVDVVADQREMIRVIQILKRIVGNDDIEAVAQVLILGENIRSS